MAWQNSRHDSKGERAGTATLDTPLYTLHRILTSTSSSVACACACPRRCPVKRCNDSASCSRNATAHAAG